MGRRRLLFAALALVATALLVLALVPGGPDDPTEGEDVKRDAGEAGTAPPVLIGTAPLDEKKAPADEDATTSQHGCVAGRVVDEEGTPVGGLAIRVGYETERTPCDESGAFRIDGVAPGWRQLAATEPKGAQVGEKAVMQVEAGTPCCEVEIVVPVARVIGGVVVTPEGLPVRDLLLAFRPAVGSGIPRGATRTDAEGRFETRVWRDGPFRATSLGVPLEGECEVERTDARLVYDADARDEMLVRILGPDGEYVPLCRLEVRSGTQDTQTSRSYQVEGGLQRVPRIWRGPYVEMRAVRARDENGMGLPLTGPETSSTPRPPRLRTRRIACMRPMRLRRGMSLLRSSSLISATTTASCRFASAWQASIWASRSSAALSRLKTQA